MALIRPCFSGLVVLLLIRICCFPSYAQRDSALLGVQTSTRQDLLAFDANEDWIFKSNGRCPCYDNSFNNVIVPSESYHRDIQMGMNCALHYNISTSFFEQFSLFHQTSLHNYDNHVMYFKFKLQIILEKKWLQEYEEFMDFLMQRVRQEGTSLTFSIHLQIKDVFDYWFNFFDKLETPNSEDSNSHDAIFSFEYNIGWDVSYEPKSTRQLVIESIFDNIQQLVGVIKETYDDEYSKQVDRWFKSLHHRFYLTVKEVSLMYVEVPMKLDLWSDLMLQYKQQLLEQLQESEGHRDQCILLGSSCAVVLKRITFPEGKYPDWRFQTFAVPPTNKSTLQSIVEGSNLPRVLCSIFTHKANHQTKVAATRNTWGRKCTAFIAFSTEDDLSIPAINLPHLGEEAYGNMWQKTRSIMQYVGKHYSEEFDWFLFGGDDMHIVVENLYDYLSSPALVDAHQSGRGVYLGRKLTVKGNLIPDSPEESIIYNSGGAGYVLDPIALKVLSNNVNHELCMPFHVSSYEDALVGRCLAKSGLSVYDSTVDTFGRQRFHLFYLGLEYEYLSFPDEIRRTHWYSNYDDNIKSGDDCCSDQSISAQHLTTHWMYAMDDFIYRCPQHIKQEFYKEKSPGFFNRRGYDLHIPNQ